MSCRSLVALSRLHFVEEVIFRKSYLLVTIAL